MEATSSSKGLKESDSTSSRRSPLAAATDVYAEGMARRALPTLRLAGVYKEDMGLLYSGKHIRDAYEGGEMLSTASPGQ